MLRNSGWLSAGLTMAALSTVTALSLHTGSWIGLGQGQDGLIPRADPSASTHPRHSDPTAAPGV